MTNLDAFIKLVAHSNAFKSIIMTCILLNTFTFAISSSLDLSPKTTNILEILDGLDSCFLAIYTMEFAIKLYSLGRGYWFNGFNCFDFGVLLCSHLQLLLSQTGVKNLGVIKVMRSLRALRPLRSISLIGGLQVVVTALISVLTGSFVHIVALLILIMFVYGIMAFYVYGYDAAEKSDLGNQYWGSLAQSCLSLFILVTAEGWTEVKDSLVELSETFSTYVFIISFLFVGHFIFGNLFVAVVIEQIDRATAGYQNKLELKKSTVIARKRKKARQNQQIEIKGILNQQRSVDFKSFHRVVLNMYTHCRCDEFLIPSNVIDSMQWVETVNTAYSLLFMRNSKIQPLHRQLVTALGEALTSMEVDPNVQDEYIRARDQALYARRKTASLYRARKMFASFAARKSGTLSTTDSSSVNSITSENFSWMARLCLSCLATIDDCHCANPESDHHTPSGERKYSTMAREWIARVDSRRASTVTNLSYISEEGESRKNSTEGKG